MRLSWRKKTAKQTIKVKGMNQLTRILLYFYKTLEPLTVLPGSWRPLAWGGSPAQSHQPALSSCSLHSYSSQRPERDLLYPANCCNQATPDIDKHTVCLGLVLVGGHFLSSLLSWRSYFADVGDDLHLATYRRDGVEEYRLEDDASGSARKVRNLREFIEKPEKQKGRRGRERMRRRWKSMGCVMTELNKTSNRKNYFGSLAGPASPRRLTESTLLFAGRQLLVMSRAARLGLKGPRGRVEESGERCTETDQR